MSLGSGQWFEFTLRPEVEGSSDFAGLWRDLAAAVRHPEVFPSGESMADHLAGHPRASQLAPQVLALLSASLVSAGDATHGDPREQVAAFMGELPLELVVSALRSQYDRSARWQLLESAVGQLPIAALPKLTTAVHEVHGRSASPALFALLDRLRTLAETLPMPHAQSAESVLRGAIVRALALASVGEGGEGVRPPAVAEVAEPDRAHLVIEPERTLAIAIMANATGDVVWSALEELLAQGRDAAVLGLLRDAEPCEAVDALARRVATPERLKALVRSEPLDLEALDTLIHALASAAAPALLEELCESESREVRRILLERLARLKDRVPVLAYARLRDRRWYVVRNMLALLRECEGEIDANQVRPLLSHMDARVRKEAVLLLSREAATREAAILAGLRDADRGVLRTALHAARSGLPDGAVPLLVARLDDAEFAPEHRVLALHLIGRSADPGALAALLRFAGTGRSLLGRARLAPKSPEMLAALAGLARSWREDRGAAALLDSAARSRDAQIANAVAGRLSAPVQEDA